MRVYFDNNQLVAQLFNSVYGGRKNTDKTREARLSLEREPGTILVLASIKKIKDGYRIHLKRDTRGSKLIGEPVYTYADTFEQAKEILEKFYNA